MHPDFDVLSTVDVRNTDEVIQTLAEHASGALRVIGSGSAQHRLPAPQQPVTLMRLAPMNRLLRLEAGDLTCSVEPGLCRAELDRILAEEKLRLACPGEGSLGGIFAEGRHTPLAPGASSTRQSLLGIQGVLAEGKAFKSGARVVKSVAGFDLHKLFVGSRGKLFVVTQMHLKLQTAPRATRHFERAGISRQEALETFSSLRRLPTTPRSLWLGASPGGFRLSGHFEGHPELLDQILAEHHLRSREEPADTELDGGEGAEVLRGLIAPKKLGQLLDTLPEQADLIINGTGQFELRVTPQQSDAFLSQCCTIPAVAEISKALPDRRGLATSSDPAGARLEQGIKEAFDPMSMLL